MTKTLAVGTEQGEEGTVWGIGTTPAFARQDAARRVLLGAEGEEPAFADLDEQHRWMDGLAIVELAGPETAVRAVLAEYGWAE